MDFNHRPPAPKFFWQTGSRRSAPVRARLKPRTGVGFSPITSQPDVLRTPVYTRGYFPRFRLTYVTSCVTSRHNSQVSVTGLDRGYAGGLSARWFDSPAHPHRRDETKNQITFSERISML